MKKAQKNSKKAPKSSSKPSDQPASRFVAGILIIFALAIIGFIAHGTLSHMAERKDMEQKTLQYLKDKYKTDFVIKDAEYQAGGLGVDGDWVMTVYHPNDPNIGFTVIDAAYDVYIETLWTKEETERLTPIIKQLFGQDAQVKINLSTKLTKENNFYKYEYTYPIPSFASVRKNLGGQIKIYLSIDQLKRTGENKPTEYYAKSLHTFIEKEIKNNQNDVNYGHYVYNKDTGMKYSCEVYGSDSRKKGMNLSETNQCYEQIQLRSGQ